MDGANGVGRAASLVLEMTSGIAIVEGREVELPLREFRLLSALAERVGEAVSNEDLVAAVWVDDAQWTPKEELYVLISRLRRLINGETKFGKNIRNRRGFGYMLDLSPSEIVLVRPGGDRVSSDAVVQLDEVESAPDAPDREAENPLPEAEVEDGPAAMPLEDEHLKTSVGRSWPSLSRAALAGAAVFVLLAASWSTGYALSARSTPSEGTANPTMSQPPEATPTVAAQPQGERDRRPQPRKKKSASRKPSREDRNNKRPSTSAPMTIGAPPPAAPAASDPVPSESEVASSNTSTASRERKPAPAPQLPPPPTRYLYHLVNRETGDHFVTTDSNTASEYQASGYRGGAIARVYSSQEKNTKAVTTNAGTAFIFVSSGAKTQPASQVVPLWYSTNSVGDFFYTTNSSEARQSGWDGSVIGYVGAP